MTLVTDIDVSIGSGLENRSLAGISAVLVSNRDKISDPKAMDATHARRNKIDFNRLDWMGRVIRADPVPRFSPPALGVRFKNPDR
jgi:hypothetical protein